MRKVFRTELNPVGFLVRAAYMYADKVALLSDLARARSDNELLRVQSAAQQQQLAEQRSVAQRQQDRAEALGRAPLGFHLRHNKPLLA